MKSDKPKISVLMPVYNGEQFLDKSIKSVLEQTFNNFEYIIINDGSTDDSLKVIESYEDSRIKIINFSKNRGISAALNNGLNVAKGDYIARQDQDDISHPERFMLQVEYLKNNDVDLVDANFIFIDENDKYIQDYEKRYFNPDETLSHLFFYEMVHASIMCKRLIFTKYNIQYRKRPTEDYDLFIRLAKAGMRAGRLDQKLIKQRKHPSSMCGSDWNNIKKDIDLMRNKFVLDLGIEPTDYEKKLHIAFVEQNLSILNQYQFREVLCWANKIIKANSIKRIYSSTYFKEQLYMRLIRLIKRKKKKSVLDLIKLRQSAEFYDKSISFRDLLYIYRFR
jgi:glycosyltransferase involved in cell wall biosynthesis